MRITPGITTTAQIERRLAAAEHAVRDAYLHGGPITDTIAQRAHRDEVLEASQGRNTVMYGEGGHPNILVRQPAYRLGELGVGLPNRVHPAFLVHGETISEVWIGKYQLVRKGSGADARVVTLPGVDPSTSIDWDESSVAARQNGAGWHLMTNAEWAAIYLQSRALGHPEQGNDNWGRAYNDHDQQGVRVDGGVPGESDDGLGRHLTGTGPIAWRHDGTAAGIADLVGNVWDWVGGLRLVDGEIQIIPDNDAIDADHSDASADWKAILEDGSLVAPGTAGTLKMEATNADGSGDVQIATAVANVSDGSAYASTYLKDVAAQAGVTVPDLLQQLALFPTSDPSGRGRVYMRNVGERSPRRGGHWRNASPAGWAAANLNDGRSSRDSDIGARAAFAAL